MNMKNSIITGLFIFCVSFQSCKQNEEGKVSEETLDVVNKLAKKTCYQAVYNQDTLDLKLTTLPDGKVSGSLVMHVEKEENRYGIVEGGFSGDTLLVSYTFAVGADAGTKFTNPLAFLKRGEELVMGNGKIENYMGASYFVKDIPIDYEKVKYKLSPVECTIGDNNE
jgi:hypothetical protein